ncbi:MAG: hypothetical protein ABIJ46_00700 [bacterium]
MAEDSEERGFTLMESVAVLGVVTLLLTLVIQVFMVSYSAYRKQSTRAENDAQAIMATRLISEAARGADEVLATATVNGTEYSSSASELVLKLPSVNTDGNVIEGEYDYLAVYRDDGDDSRIYVDTEPNAGSYRPSGQKLLTSDNDWLIFRYDSPNVAEASRVSVFLRNAKTARDTTVISESWTSIFIRNR